MASNPQNTLETSFLHNYFVEIPAGNINMRDDRTKAEWSVEINTFLLAKYPVTQAFYREVMKQSPSSFTGDQKPVDSVTWMEAVKFCNSLSNLCGLQPCYTPLEDTQELVFAPERNGFRLPDEAEWQYACQAGSTATRYGDLTEIAWYKENSSHTSQEVGKKAPNKWGLYDMLGNVWEWCSDIYDEEVYGSYRVFRGGGWCDQERSVMATTRRRSHPSSFKIDDLGFRIARTMSF